MLHRVVVTLGFLLVVAPSGRAQERAPLMPFLWTQGQSPETIRKVVGEVAEGGNCGFVWESRPHPDYLGPRWWSDLGLAIAEAKRLGLEVWIFDEFSFPSGVASGKVVAENPNFRNWVLLERSLTVTGPADPKLWEIPGGLGESEQVVSVVAFPEPYAAGSTPIDLTPSHSRRAAAASLGRRRKESGGSRGASRGRRPA